jgi:hypothetical protein
VPRFSPRTFCEAVEKEGITHTLLTPTMLNTLTKFSGAKQFDLSLRFWPLAYVFYL